MTGKVIPFKRDISVKAKDEYVPRFSFSCKEVEDEFYRLKRIYDSKPNQTVSFDSYVEFLQACEPDAWYIVLLQSLSDGDDAA
jgi:hypothetical protein